MQGTVLAALDRVSCAARAPERSLARGGFVSARTFEDSAGTVWEVFEVQRSSQNAQAVSAGLEKGWLAFVSGSGKRRLAPYPTDWYASNAAELERLCGQARIARDMGLSVDGARSPGRARHAGADGAERSDAASRTRVPRVRSARAVRDIAGSDQLPIIATATSADSVESTVREFARQARRTQLPAIEAMVRLKALLARVYLDTSSAARDIRAVRRWFVESYYFERDLTEPDPPGQSR